MSERPRHHAAHAPVLLTEVVNAVAEHLGENAQGVFIDGTLGAGGHAAALLERFPGLSLLGTDWDPDSLALARERLAEFGERAQIVQASLSDLDALLSERTADDSDTPLAGMLVDLGVCSLHFDRPERGFSLQADGPLDMRMSPARETTAADIVNNWSEERLADLFYREGGERASRRAAAAVVDGRRRAPFLRTLALADCIERAIPRSGKVHPATKVFQALRRAVNDEAGELERALAAADRHLAPGGLLLTITFHSGEDGVVKRFASAAARAGRFEVLTKRGIAPQHNEVRNNARARSARLRIARRVAIGDSGDVQRGDDS